MNRKHLGIVLACTIGNAVGLTPAVHAVFGIFLIPLATEFGWRRAEISGVLGLTAIISAVVLPIAGGYADLHGARRVALIGNLLLAAAIAGLAFADGSLVHFYLSFAAVAVAGSIAGSALFSKIISDWFDRQRGAMLGLTAGVGNGVGATVMPIAAALMLPAWGWRGTYLGLAAIVAAVGFPVLWFLLRDAPRYHAEAEHSAEPVAGLTLGEAMATPVFWVLLFAIAIGAGSLTAIFSHVVPLLAERHIGLATATAVIGVFAIATAAWQTIVGTLLDRMPSAKLAAPFFLVAVPGLYVFQAGQTTPSLMLAGVLLGIGLGTQYGVMPYFVARYFGVRSYGAIIGVMYAVVALFQGGTPILLDHVFDVEGSYRNGIVMLGAALAAGAGLVLLLPPYKRAPVEALLRASPALG